MILILKITWKNYLDFKNKLIQQDYVEKFYFIRNSIELSLVYSDNSYVCEKVYSN